MIRAIMFGAALIGAIFFALATLGCVMDDKGWTRQAQATGAALCAAITVACVWAVVSLR